METSRGYRAVAIQFNRYSKSRSLITRCIQQIEAFDEGELMTVLDVALLFECEQIFDVDTGLQHSTRIAVSKSTKVQFPKSVLDYHRIGEYLARKEPLN